MGALNPSHLVFGSFATAPTATVAESFYDRTTGNLWYDRDGTGLAAAILAMVFDNHANLDASDFIVGS